MDAEFILLKDTAVVTTATYWFKNNIIVPLV